MLAVSQRGPGAALHRPVQHGLLDPALDGETDLIGDRPVVEATDHGATTRPLDLRDEGALPYEPTTVSAELVASRKGQVRHIR